MGNPYLARRWREQGSEGVYGDALPDDEPGLPQGVVQGPPAPDGLAPDANRRDTLSWVGSDPDRAQLVHEWEAGKAEPRVTVLEMVRRIAGRA